MNTDASFEKDPDLLKQGMVNRLLLSMVLIVAPYMLDVPIWVGPFVAALLIWRHRLERLGRPLPPTWAKAVLVGGVMSALLLDQGTLMGRDAGATFLITLLAIKMLEVRRRRDFIVVSFLLYFMIVGALLFSQAILMTVYLMGATFLVTASLVRLQMGGDRALSRQSWGFTWRLFRQALPLAIPLFVLFPRMQGHWALQLYQISMGLQETMEPGALAKLATDDHVAFRVEFPGGTMPSGNHLYWRAFILWETDGVRWKPGRRPEWQVPSPPSGPTVEQTIVLMPHTQNWFPALDHPVRATSGLHLNAARTLESNFGLYRKWQYTAWSSLDAPVTEMSPFIRDQSLQEPRRVSPKIRLLVRQWKEQSPEPEAVVRSALQYFRQHGFIYTLSPGVYSSADPVSEFLFERKQGFCEHYASAFTLLMRVAGIPARVVVGYLGGEFNPYGNFMVVRQKDAHAWSEVWIEGKGWVRIDPTAAISADFMDPALGVRQAMASGGLSASEASERQARARIPWLPSWLQTATWSVSLWWGLGEERWDQWMTQYDGATQESILKRLGLKDFGWHLVIGLITAAILTTLAVLATRLRRPARETDPVRRLYRSFCNSLATAGTSPEPWEPPLTFTRRAAQRFPTHAAAIEEIGDLHTRLRYGRPGQERITLKALAEKIRHFRRKFRG